jgi:hypothetical protein
LYGSAKYGNRSETAWAIRSSNAERDFALTPHISRRFRLDIV